MARRGRQRPPPGLLHPPGLAGGAARPDGSVGSLLEMGYDLEQATLAMEMSGGDVQAAVTAVVELQSADSGPQLPHSTLTDLITLD